MAKVAFVKTSKRIDGVPRALELLGLNPVEGKQVLLKPNLNSRDPAPGSTHPKTLRTLIEELWAMGASSITVADRSGMDKASEVMRVLGILEMAQELEFETLDFADMGTEGWERIQPPDSHWEAGFAFARPGLEAEALVQTCCLKTHRYGGHFTMSLKNSVGMVATGNMDELHASPYQRLMIAEVNSPYVPALIVLDGIKAFVSGGPDTGRQVSGDVVLAGTDRVAIDAIGVALLRHLGVTGVVARGPIFAQEQIARAVELGLGVDIPQKIQLLTDDADSADYAALIQEILLAE
jgi:uncharacterized protein (DUF362 family)